MDPLYLLSLLAFGVFAAATTLLGPPAALLWIASRIVPLPRPRLAALLAGVTPWSDEVLEAAADELGLELRRRRRLLEPVAVGAVDRHPVELRLELLVLREAEALEVELRVGGLPPELTCHRADRLLPTRTGDPSFDEHVSFVGPREPLATRLPASTRHALEDLVQVGGAIHGGVLTVRHVAPDLLGAADVVAMVRRAIAAARALDRGPVPLREIVTSDPEPAVRLCALDELLCADPDRAWLRALAAGEDEVAVRAASFLGDHDRLRALLAGPAALPALLALAGALTEPERAVDLAIGRLLAEAPDPRVLEVAGRIGSVAVIPDLLRVAGPLERAARRAVAAIQARSTGLQGGLALVDPDRDEGRLSVATPAGGELSEPPRRGPG